MAPRSPELMRVRKTVGEARTKKGLRAVLQAARRRRMRRRKKQRKKMSNVMREGREARKARKRRPKVLVSSTVGQFGGSNTQKVPAMVVPKRTGRTDVGYGTAVWTHPIIYVIARHESKDDGPLGDFPRDSKRMCSRALFKIFMCTLIKKLS